MEEEKQLGNSNSLVSYAIIGQYVHIYIYILKKKISMIV